MTLGQAKKPQTVEPAGAGKLKVGAAAKRKIKAESKVKKVKAEPTSTVEKVLKYVPKKTAAGKKSVPAQKASATGGKKSVIGTTDEMTMTNFKKYLAHQKKTHAAQQSGKHSSGKKTK